MLLAADNEADLQQVKDELQKRLLCKDLGEVRNYLGMEISRDRTARTISLSQAFYLEKLTGYSDSSWADSQPDRRSSQGYGFSLGSGLISWRSTRSSSIALSSCEAELYAITMAAQEARTIHLTKEAVFHGRSKHIALRHYFVRELVQAGHLTILTEMAHMKEKWRT
ncbi:hypothetical protein CLOP_g2705 [Closterium sp. NIES-67]|nr:hypothetical protein CLOP_g2705 [Closterium sp. NIES-67]